MSRPTPVLTLVAVVLLASMSLAAALRGEIHGDQSSVAGGRNAVALPPELKSRLAACIGRSSSGVRSVYECLFAIVKQHQQGNAIHEEKINEEHKTSYMFSPQSSANEPRQGGLLPNAGAGASVGAGFGFGAGGNAGGIPNPAQGGFGFGGNVGIPNLGLGGGPLG